MISDKSELLIEKLISLAEEDFTKRALIPLFMAMGYKTDYHGGQYEGGKDIIFWRMDDFDEKELTVVQVKKISESAAASDSTGFSTVITQLSQAIEKSAPDLDGTKRTPDKVIFITPYKINTRALESRFEGYISLRNRGGRVYDGTQIAKQLIEKNLPIVAELLGKEYEIRQSSITGLSNKVLLNALGYGKERSVRHFYTDLDFGIGKVRTGTFLDKKFTPSIIKSEQNDVQWNSLKMLASRIEQHFHVDVTRPTISQIEDNYRQQVTEWENPKNQKIVNDIKITISAIDELIDGLNYSMGQIRPEISSRQQGEMGGIFDTPKAKSSPDSRKPRNSYVTEKAERAVKVISKQVDDISNRIYKSSEIELKDKDELLELARSIEEDEWPTIRTFIETFKISSLKSLKDSIESNVRKLNQRIGNLFSHIAKQRHQPKFIVEIDGEKLAHQLRQEQKQISEKLLKLQNAGKHDKQETKSVFNDCLHTLRIVEAIFSDPRFHQPLGITDVDNDPNSNLTATRIHIEIDKLFDTGMNIILFGDAGAGKTTTLDMYALKTAESDHQGWLPLFLPLTKIVERTDKPSDHNNDHVDLLEKCIVRYFIKNNLVTSREELRAVLEKKERVVFLFDGFDEVSKSSPWLANAIPQLSRFYPNSQIIISTRLTGEQLNGVDFLKLTLMPFDEAQLERFITAWFQGNTEKVNLISKHLNANSQVSAVVKTPLLATILCILAENSVPLPTSELSLYKERLKLLLGHYDIHKGIKRQESTSELLEEVARKIAFGLHSSIKRMNHVGELIEISTRSLATKYETKAIELAVKELCDPCNVLIPMSVQGEWGFGHLRYQEHLVAEELIRNRGIEIDPYLTIEWWRSALVLFAKLTDDFESLFTKYIISASHIGNAHATIKAMILARPKRERDELMLLLRQHKKMDDQAPAPYDQDEYFYS